MLWTCGKNTACLTYRCGDVKTDAADPRTHKNTSAAATFGMSLIFFFNVSLSLSCLDRSLIFWDAYIFSRGFLREHMVSIMRPPANTNRHAETFPSSASPNPTPPPACLRFPLTLISCSSLLFFQSFKSSLPPVLCHHHSVSSSWSYFPLLWTRLTKTVSDIDQMSFSFPNKRSII